MCWTEQHDKRLIGEIALVDPFTGTKKGTVQRGKKWDEITENLFRCSTPYLKWRKGVCETDTISSLKGTEKK